MPAVPPAVLLLVGLLVLGLLTVVIGAWIWLIVRLALGQTIVPRWSTRIVPWGFLSVVAAVVAWLAIQVAVPIGYYYAIHGAMPHHKPGESQFTPTEMMVASAIQNTTILVVVPLLLAGLCGARPRDFGLLDPRRGWRVVQGMAAWPLMAPLIYGMMALAVRIWGKQSHPLETAIQNEGVGGMAAIFFLAGAVLAPAAEELIFRGVLLGWLTSLVYRVRPTDALDRFTIEDDASVIREYAPAEPMSHSGPDDDANWLAPPQATIDPILSEPGQITPEPPTGRQMVWLAVANVVVSLLFAGLHYQVWPTPVPIFFLSLALGSLYQRTGSLVAPVALHMTFNGVSTVLMLLTLGMGMKLDPAEPPKEPIPIPAPLPKAAPPVVGMGPIATRDFSCRNRIWVVDSDVGID